MKRTGRETGGHWAYSRDDKLRDDHRASAGGGDRGGRGVMVLVRRARGHQAKGVPERRPASTNPLDKADVVSDGPLAIC
jgi:hypothetical protein